MATNKHPPESFVNKPLSLVQLQGLQAVVDEHAIVSITDVTGNISYVNDKFCEISGFSRDELLGKNHRIVKSTAHSTSFFRKMWRTIAAGDTWQGLVENHKKDGSSYWVQTTIMPLLNERGKPGQYISIRTDVSERIRAQWALAHFKHILDQTLDSVFLFDSQTLKYLYVNLGAVELVGYTEPELLAMVAPDIKPDMSESQFREKIAPLITGEIDHLTFETTHLTKTGQQLPVEMFLQYFPEDNGHGQCIAIVRDISERNRVNSALSP